ncbi:MAG: chromosome partitioning protein ParB, partial [Clostridiales bacterium]|nr:chromosome partitioning protein ParB [Clostridiales bacterium]
LVYNAIEERLKNIIGTKVSIHRRQDNKGKIEIEYYSDEDLERIIEIIDSQA